MVPSVLVSVIPSCLGFSGVLSLSAFSGDDWFSGPDEKSTITCRGVVKDGFRKWSVIGLLGEGEVKMDEVWAGGWEKREDVEGVAGSRHGV